MYFQYLQLRHAARAQFLASPSLGMDPIEELLAQEQLLKPLSAPYLALLRVESPKMDRLWDKWKTDFPNFDRKDCLEDNTRLLITSKKKVDIG